MAIVDMADIYEFIDVDKGYFTITAANDVIKLKYDSGAVTNVEMTDGTYEGETLATELQSKMNTALSSAGTVTYSTTTRKFSFGAGTGHLLAYTHSGSDGGLTVGFDKDHSAALTLTSDLAANDPSTILEVIRDSVESWIQSYCRRTFESTTYKEVYDGSGTSFLYLKQYPITEVTLLSIGTQDAIKITNTTAITASASVNATGLVLTADGVSNSSVTFAGYATMTLLVAAVNALGSGWSASLMSSLFGSIASSELVPQYGKSMVSRYGDSEWIYLKMADSGEDDFEVYVNRGQIYLSSGFSAGNNNVYCNYTAGYSSTTMPNDLKLAVKIMVKRVYQSRQEEMFGVRSYNVGDQEVLLDERELPYEVKDILSKYRRPLI